VCSFSAVISVAVRAVWNELAKSSVLAELCSLNWSWIILS